MGQAESKELVEDERCAELREIAENRGPVAVLKYLQENVQKWKEEKSIICCNWSKIDDDIRNAEDDDKTEEEVIPAIRKQIYDQISRYDHLKNSDAIFLISSRRKDIGDWPQYKTLRKRIKFATASAAVITATPLPRLDFIANIGILVEEVKHYINVFGLDDKILDTLTGLDRRQLKCTRFLVTGKELSKLIIAQLGKYAAILAVDSAVDFILPIIGSVMSAGTSSVVTYRYLNRTLDDFRDDARFVYRFILDKQNPQS
ncbi:unnamed protein product [Mytilus coruscus]|uniref:Uncharacterized protein n=1 Tax=Mytilus coruscus TaxID=42192 RepID=A0A6J8CF16_MYTCO|nr:unnamed protein product [Mytilus coruscus]